MEGLGENPRAMLPSRTKTALLLLIGGGILLALTTGMLFPLEAVLVERWRQELQTIPDDEIRVRIEQIAAVGNRGVPVLVEALHSDRQAVADTAFELLQKYLDEQELLSAENSSPNIAALATILARQCERRGAFAADSNLKLVTRLLLWPTLRRGIDNEQLVADCETVIRTFAVDSIPTTERASARVVAAQYREFSAQTIITEDVLDLPGGGVMTELAEIPELPRAENDSVDNDMASRHSLEPQPFFPATTSNILGRTAQNWKDLPSQPPSSSASTVPTPRSDFVLPPPAPTPPVRQQVTDLQLLTARSDLEVMQQLAIGSPHVAQKAIEELTRRGFRPRDLRLAERLVNADPDVRLELVNSLPQLSGIDSRPWLIWLSSDPDSLVRRAAVSIIATGDDQALFDHLRQVEQTETDEEVLRLIRRALARR
jgi:hypothetical protein